ncbi:Spy/CpxP family protein refolding chaperone [Bacterioplanoides sp. SCSIO 12839]|uniref:Spy/CpxP family protein refolding chaperone n=1 Tax=Bacterioplanoides sp. SCSIO 12839 TaxID=2829569 RepID=UPI00210719B5|nr:Spy/CpxP family protein refolding chaperone [Bacterioplanoides sp. SCSIO 12839]UTW48103.1 Spy/CpxP family protein refolding chaperone [Bacterioplanoides sp. SCSIO 12839]
MKRFFLQPLASLAAGTLLSAQALAFDGSQRAIDWEDELDLTEQQEDQIDAIEDKYHKQFRELRKSHKTDTINSRNHGKPQQAQHLMKQMREEIQQVLTKEQRAEARKLVSERRREAMEKRLRKMAKKLDMTDEQKSQLKQTLNEQSQQYHWPMDHAQRQQARAHFDEAMQDILTGEQQQEWQAMKSGFKKRWHHEGDLKRNFNSDDHNDDGYRTQKGHQKNNHYNNDSQGGFRKGYQDW